MKRIALLLWVIMLSGCANNVWVNDTKSAQEVQRDFNDCKYEAEKNSFVPYGGGVSPISAGIQEGVRSVQLMNSCMTSRGHYLISKVELDSKNAEFNQLIAEYKSAMDKKDYKRALSTIDSIISKYPTNADHYYAKGHLYSVMGKYNEAIPNFDKALALGHKNINVITYKTQCLIELGEYDVAIEVINQALSTRVDASLFNMRAYALNMKGEFDKALEDCNRSISLDSSKPNPFKNRGLVYLGKSDYKKAIEEFNKSIGIQSDYGYAYEGRGDVHSKLGEIDLANADYKKACEFGVREACRKLPQDKTQANIK